MRYLQLHYMVCVGAFCLVTLCAVSQAGQPRGPLAGFAQQRSWSDESGRFNITAAMTFADAKEVRLEKTDGNVVTVPLAKLSKADQSYIQGFLAAEKALGAAGQPEGDDDADNPFAGGTPSTSSGNDRAAAMAAGRASSAAEQPIAGDGTVPGSLEERAAVLKGFKPLTIAPAAAFWSAQPPVAFPKVEFDDVVLETPLAKPFFAAMRVMAAGKSGTLVLNAYQQGRGSREKDNYSKFVIASAATGNASAIYEFDQPWKVMAISADATRIAAVRIEGFDKGNEVAIMRIASGQVIPEFRFTAGGGSWDELHWVAFLPGNRLVTISQKHDLTIWDLDGKPGPRALLRGSSGKALSAEITMAGELIAIPFGTSIAVIETGAGKLVGCITRDQAANRVTFSPDGKLLAAFHPFNIALYSTADGKEVRNIAVAESKADAAIRWVGEHLMVSDVLYDVQRGVPVWTYESGAQSRTALGNYLVSGFGNDKGSTINLLRLPHEEALRAAKDIDPSEIYAVVPGDSVSLKFDIAAAPQNVQQLIRQAAEDKVNQLGWKLVDGASTTLVVKLEQGEQQEAEYYSQRGFGPFPSFAPPGFGGRPTGPAEKVQFRPWTHTFAVQVAGEEIYTSKYVRSSPDHLQTKDGESTQAAVTRQTQPSPEYFRNVAVPPHLMKKQFQQGLGKSKIEPAGVR